MTNEGDASSPQGQEDQAARDRRISSFTSTALKGGASPDSIAESLVSRGDFYSLDSAHEFISRMITALQEQAARDEHFQRHRTAKADVIFGALLTIIGVVVIYLTSSLGVGVILMYGAIIGGVLMLLRGLFRLATLPREPS